MSKTINNKPINSFPTDNRNAEIVSKRVKKDLAWVIVSVALALAAAAATYMLIKPA
ncbi:hypothetical protein SAMN05660649_01073 [Desulfotomaculum arcticum]|uniref:Uncharacterized protein n=1 Tax=Desulfotruncus arcticus DSM 17038 TaxID=1121424 RepID=A0A1I2Q510_9FIRM|nr:hypothetical protein [Desulfotruncus arcticus]SFG23472.1 hypothetical protein SAMN05660649_01073 [Desulfotomaculum arcticum] [Desulfotruncus arcticus DSM 17038]